MLGYCSLMIYAGFDHFHPAFLTLNKVTTVPWHYATAVGEEKKKKKWVTSSHHGPTVVNTTARGGCLTAPCSSSLEFVAVDARVSS